MARDGSTQGFPEDSAAVQLNVGIGLQRRIPNVGYRSREQPSIGTLKAPEGVKQCSNGQQEQGKEQGPSM